MRLKQQSFVDKYIEVVILAVAVIISLAVIGLFVVGTPYSVEVAPGKTATPAEVEAAYLAQARTLEAAVNRDEPPQELANLKIPDYVSRFNDRYSQRLVQSDSFYAIVFGPPGIADLGLDGGVPVLRNVDAKIPPAAQKVTAQPAYHVLESDEALTLALGDVARAQYPDAKDDLLKALTEDWRKKAVALAGARNPRDFWSVTVTGSISPQDWIDAIAKVPAEKKMPESWYEELAQFISGIDIQRQVLDPATGQWGSPTTVQSLPGAVSDILRAYVVQVQEAKTKNLDADETGQLQVALVENLRFYQEDLVKPQFLPVKAHRPWTEPDHVPLELAPADQQALLKINQQINKYQSELRGLIGRTGTGGAEGTRPGGVIPPRINANYEEGFIPTPGRTPQPPRITPTPKTKQPGPGVDPAKKNPNEDRIKLYQTRLADLMKQRDEILGKLIKDRPEDSATVEPSGPGRPVPRRNPGEGRGEFFDPEFVRPGTGRPRLPGQPGYPGRPGGPEEGDGTLQPIKFWTHDVDVKPGGTYRYRVVYRVINPLFNKEEQLIEPLRPQAAKLEQESVESEWTQPITIEPPVRFFVEDVRPETATVTWGIYRIYNGYRLHKQFTTRPGDPIGKPVEVEVKDDQGGAAGKEVVDLSVPQLLLDLKTPARQAGAIGFRGPMTVLVADSNQGTVSTRDPVADRENPDRIRLFNEATGALQTTPPAGGTGEFPGFRPPEGGLR